MLRKSVLLLVVVGAVIAVSGCTAAPRIYTPNELPAAAPALVGKNITVQGIAVAHKVVCTNIQCTDNQCCNVCGSPLSVAGEGVKIRLRGSYDLKPIGCSGSECAQTCYPLTLGEHYQVTGTLRDDGVEYYLEFLDFRNTA